MSFNILTQKEYYDAMVQYFIANQTNITDVNSGSAIDTQINAFATQLNQAQVKASGGFKAQFEQIPFQVFDFQRRSATFSSGTAVFSRQSADPVQIDIPIGTVIGTSGGLLYTTQNAVSILSGNLSSSSANITANKVGGSYNVLAGVINIINSSLPGVNSVTNNTATSGGTDKETNPDYYTRFKNYILGLSGSNDYGIFTAANSVSTIQSAYVENHFPPEAGLYNFTVYVDDGSGSVPQTVLDQVTLVVRGNNTSTYQGYASAGVNFRVLSAGLIPSNIIYTAKINPLIVDPAAAQVNIESIIKNYINSLWVGSDVIRAEVIKIIQGATGVIDVPVLTLNGTTDNIVTTASQVARVNTITPTITS